MCRTRFIKAHCSVDRRLTTQLENVIANPVCLFKNNGMHFNRLSNNIHMENIIVQCFFFFLFLFEVNTVVTGTTGLRGDR